MLALGPSVLITLCLWPRAQWPVTKASSPPVLSDSPQHSSLRGLCPHPHRNKLPLTCASFGSLPVPRITSDFLSDLLQSAWQARVKWGHPGQPEASPPLLPLASLQVTKRVCFLSHHTKLLFPVNTMQLLQNWLEREPHFSCLSRRRL